MIPHFCLAQGYLERARLQIGPKQNRLSRPRHSSSEARVVNLLGDGSRFLLFICKNLQADPGATPFLRPELFYAPAQVMLNESVSRFENGVGRAVVLFERDDLHLRKIFLHVEEVRDLCPAPSIDTLVV